MQLIKRGDTGPAGAEVRDSLVDLGLLPPGEPVQADEVTFDAACELALREFQQSRGLVADGIVGLETWHALVAARWRLGDRILNLSLRDPMLGDDVRQLQERLLEMGYDVGRADGVFGPRTERTLVEFQRDCGLVGDGVFGPASMQALRKLGRKVVGGRPQLLRESAKLDHSGPALSGKRVVIDPGHGGTETEHGPTITVDGQQWGEAQLCHDVALRLEGRFTAVGVQAHLTRGSDSDPSNLERAKFANEVGADILISLHTDRHDNPAANGVACYHFGTGSGATSTVGEQLASLVQREIVARTGLQDCRIHAKTWEMLRLTRMPAVHVEVGYLTSTLDRGRLADAAFRDRVADAILAAVQRIFLPRDLDCDTGTLDVRQLRSLELA